MKMRTVMSMLALGAGLASGVASAATFSVDSTADAVDNDPGNGVCLSAGGACTLRAAVMEANALAGADVIDLSLMNNPLEPITLTIDGVDETFDLTPTGAAACVAVITADASRGDLDITQDLTVTGAGPGLTVIQWDEQSLTDPNVGDRIFHIQANAGETVNLVRIADVMVTRGSVGIPNDLDPENPYNCEVTGEAGSLQATQFRRFGGGIAVGPGATVAIFQEEVHGPGGGGGGSQRPPDVGGPGGDEGEETGGVTAVEFERIAVIGNWSGSDAGGLIAAAEMSIAESVFSGNLSSANGGALYLDSPTTIEETLIGASSTDVPYSSGPVSATLLAPNQGENGGGIFATGSHTSSIESSAINGNTATGGGGIAGRSLVTLNITNSTVSGNTAADVGGGITTNGGVNLRNVTLANNNSASDAEGGGAGLNSFGSGTYTFFNTILSNNTVGAEGAARDASCGCTGGESVCPPGRMVSTGYNLSDETLDTCSLSASLSDQLATDPLLEPLSNNGGLTETHALPSVAAGDVATSPAVDTADNSRCPNNDQRGSLRPDDGDLNGSYVCDVGAYERFIARNDLHINNVTAPNQVDKGDAFDVVVEVHNDDGNAPAPGVTLDATLDPVAGMSIVAAAASAGTCNVASSAVVNCTLGDLAIGEIRTVTLSVTSDTQGVYALTSTVAQSGDPDLVDVVPGNNTVVSQIAVIGNSDIGLTGGPAAATVDQGDNVTFDYVVANAGEDDASNVRFGMVLPASAAFVSATSSAGAACVESAGEVLCPIGDLAVGETADVEVVLTANEAGAVNFEASAVADQNDSDLTDNTIVSTVTVIANADLAVTLTSSNTSVYINGSFSVTARVANNGPQAATNMVLTSTLPSSVSFVSATGCTIAGSVVTCTSPSIASGSNSSFTLNLRGIARGTATITAAATSDENDPVPANDSGSVSVSILKKSSGGGGCAYNPGGPVDPTLPGLLLASLLALLWRRRVSN